LNLIVDAFYPIGISDGFLGQLFEVVVGQEASQEQHAIQAITRDAFQSLVRVAVYASLGYLIYAGQRKFLARGTPG